MQSNYKVDVYQPRLEEGILFQDFITMQLHKVGIVLQPINSKRFQLERENLLGLEIKYDRKMSVTGNLYFETAEKADPNNPRYVPSGIYRADKCWLYGIGDYREFHIFSKTMLRILHKKGHGKRVENGTKTSKGFVLPVEQAKVYSAKTLRWPKHAGG